MLFCGILWFCIFYGYWMCPRTLNQFLLISFAGFEGERKPNFYSNMQSMPLSGIFGWSVTIASLTRIRSSKSCRIRLVVCLLFGAKHMIFFWALSSHICWENKIFYSFNLFLLLVLVSTMRILCPSFSLSSSSLYF